MPGVTLISENWGYNPSTTLSDILVFIYFKEHFPKKVQEFNDYKIVMAAVGDFHSIALSS